MLSVEAAKVTKKKLRIIKYPDTCGRSRRLKYQDANAVIHSFLYKNIF